MKWLKRKWTVFLEIVLMRPVTDPCSRKGCWESTAGLSHMCRAHVKELLAEHAAETEAWIEKRPESQRAGLRRQALMSRLNMTAGFRM